MSNDTLTASRRAALQAALGGILTGAQIDAVLADEALLRGYGETLSAHSLANEEAPFNPVLPPESEPEGS